jgi:hypothetical protein
MLQLHADGESLSRAAREERAALQLQVQHVQQSELKQQVVAHTLYATIPYHTLLSH